MPLFYPVDLHVCFPFLLPHLPPRTGCAYVRRMLSFSRYCLRTRVRRRQAKSSRLRLSSVSVPPPSILICEHRCSFSFLPFGLLLFRNLVGRNRLVEYWRAAAVPHPHYQQIHAPFRLDRRAGVKRTDTRHALIIFDDRRERALAFNKMPMS